MQFDPRRSDLTLGIIGTGAMGRGIAQVAATGGMRVLMTDARAGAAAEAKAFVAKMLERAVEKGSMSKDAQAAAVGRLEVVDGPAAMAPCHLVIEVIVEDLAAKQALFAQLEGIVGENCILATNTSSLAVTTIAAKLKRPERFAGMHFFNPVPLMKLVEVIDGVRTAPEVGDALMEVGRRMGREPVRVKDAPGFIVNQVGRGFGVEAAHIASEGIASFVDIDRIMRDVAGFRMGPFELMELTGLDVSQPASVAIYEQCYHEPRYRPAQLMRSRFDAALTALLQSLKAPLEGGATPSAQALILVTPYGDDATACAVAQGLDAKRTVAVDTLFPMVKRRTIMTTPVTDPAYRDAAHVLLAGDGVPVTAIKDSPGFIAQRIVAMIVNIGCYLAQSRTAAPADIDKGATLGLNYPHGPMAFGDVLGPAKVLKVLENMMKLYADPRYRPNLWLTRRARLGVSLLTADS